MLKTTKLTKTFYNNNPIHSQPIQLFTPSTTSSSGSMCDTEPSSISSSCKSTMGMNDDYHDDSLIILVDKLKRELATVKQARSQLATLYKVKCKSDLDKSAKITKLRLQYEYEMNTFCKEDQKDLVCYLQRQLLIRDQRINELSFDLEQLRNSSMINYKTQPIKILRSNDPDLVISTNRRFYDGQERDNLELHDRVKKFDKDHDKELIKRVLSKQNHEYNKLLTKKDEQIAELTDKLKRLSQSNPLEVALRQANIEKLHLEKRLLSSTSSLNSTTTTNADPTTRTVSTSSHDEQPYSSRTSTSSPMDPLHQQAMQKTNDMLRTEIHRLTQTNEENMNKLKLQVKHFDELQETSKQLEIKYNQLLEFEEQYRRNIDELKERNESLENEILTMKSSQAHHQDLQINIERLQTEIQLSINERENVSIINTQLRNEITNLMQRNERLNNECDSKQHEIENCKQKILDLESIIKSLRETIDYQKRLNEENELNKQELKRKQADFEQFEKMHDATKHENQATIQFLQEKITDLERKTELQSMKHEDILRQFQSLKSNSNRTLFPFAAIKDDSAPIGISQRNDRIAQIVIAKYSYEPLKYSPNDHPESELPLKLGEYYLVYGDIDEDGFYDGRNLDGRYGLIPSNFIELVTNPNDLPEQTKQIISKLTGRTFATSNERQTRPSIESDVFTPSSLRPLESISSDISNEEHSTNKHIPFPTHLRIEKSFSNSVLIAWTPPITDLKILGYQVLLDQTLYTTINMNERSRALIENLNLNEQSHRINIRSITQRGLSRDQQCTLLLTNSKELTNMPTDLRVDRITQTTAVVSWWPASNDLAHRLYVNDIEVQILKAGIYRFKLSGLLPNTVHKVTIQAKPMDTTSPQQQSASSIEFRTNAFDSERIFYTVTKHESVQPPKRIQVIPGPQANTLLVSWEQLSSISTTRGYRVLIDGRQIQDVNNPLNDHTLINLKKTYSGRYLTVRTLTDDGGESNDSIPIDLEDILKKNTTRTSSIYSHDLPTPLINGKEKQRESSSTISSISTELPQIELRANTPRTPTTTQSADISPNRLTPDVANRKTSISPRSFIALFDYDPQAMSPNQDSEEELPFKQGQIIKIFGNQDADGFYIGQIENGRTGFVPSNMVKEIEPDNHSPVKLPTPTIEKSSPLKESSDEKETKQQTTTDVKNESDSSVNPVPAPAESGFFDRIKSTFSWNLNEPI